VAKIKRKLKKKYETIRLQDSKYTRESDGVQREGPEAAGLERSRAFVRRETRGMNVACSRFPGNSMNTKYEVGRSVEPPRCTLPASLNHRRHARHIGFA